METKHTECKISGTLYVILYISKVMGIAPLKFEKTQNEWRVKTCTKADVYGKSLIVIMCIFSVLSVASAIFIRKFSNALISLFKEFEIICIMILLVTVGLAGAFSGMKRMKHFVNYQAQISEINTKIGEFCTQNKPKEWKTLIPVMCIWVCGNLLLLLDCSLHVITMTLLNGHMYWQLLDIFNYILFSVMHLACLQYYLICSSVLSSFRQLNLYFKELLVTIQDGRAEEQLSISTVMLNRLSHFYCTLCDIVRTVSETYGILLLPLLSTIIFYLLLALCQLIVNIALMDAHNLYLLFDDIVWIALQFCNLFLIIEPCHRTHVEINVSKILTSKLMHRTHCSQRDFFDDLQQLYRQLIYNGATFTPLGLFIMSRNLFMTTMGLITTYLVIMISSLIH